MPGTEPTVTPPTEASAAAAASSNEAVGRRSPSRTIRENVHTSVLGRDAGDSTREIGFASENNGDTPEVVPAAPNETGGWWGSGLFGGSHENNSNTANPTNAHRKRRNGNAKYDGLQQSLEEGGLNNNHYDPPNVLSTNASVATDSLATTIGTATTREDRVRQDCSNFFRGIEDDPSSPVHRTRTHRGSGRTAAAANSLLRRMSVRARLTGEVDGALFMSRYERLNQMAERPSRRRGSRYRHLRGQQYTGNDNSSSTHNEDGGHNDLFLDEDDGADQPPSSYREHIPSPTNNVVMGASSLANPHGVRSRMFFEQDGKMLMRLPRDQVRLVMDYNLEPGILAVEQWRSQQDAEAASEKLATQNARTRQSMRRERERRQREKERRRRRRRRRRRKMEQQQQQQQQQQSTSDGEKPKDDQASTDAKDPSQVNGQKLPAEGTEENRPIDIEDPHTEDDDDDSYSSYSNDDDSNIYDDDLDEAPEDLLPELKYVITIPDDLYRRIVGEISAKAFPPYWGFFKCCNQEQERADIKLALVILAVVMFLLFIGSLEWRTT